METKFQNHRVFSKNVCLQINSTPLKHQKYQKLCFVPSTSVRLFQIFCHFPRLFRIFPDNRNAIFLQQSICFKILSEVHQQTHLLKLKIIYEICFAKFECLYCTVYTDALQLITVEHHLCLVRQCCLHLVNEYMAVASYQ